MSNLFKYSLLVSILLIRCSASSDESPPFWAKRSPLILEDTEIQYFKYAPGVRENHPPGYDFHIYRYDTITNHFDPFLFTRGFIYMEEECLIWQIENDPFISVYRLLDFKMSRGDSVEVKNLSPMGVVFPYPKLGVRLDEKEYSAKFTDTLYRFSLHGLGLEEGQLIVSYWTVGKSAGITDILTKTAPEDGSDERHFIHAFQK